MNNNNSIKNKIKSIMDKFNAKAIEVKIQARSLFENSNQTIKDIAETVGVSQNTMTVWIKKYGWKKTGLGNVDLFKSDNLLVAFLQYTKSNNEELYQELQKTFRRFCEVKKSD